MILSPASVEMTILFGSEASTTKQLLRFVFFEEGSGLFQVEEVSVDGHLVAAGVFRNGDDVLDTMAFASEGFNEKIDIYHALESTRFRFL
jgi:hypothetical protein